MMYLTYSYRAGFVLAALACAIAAWPGLAQTAEAPRTGRPARRAPPPVRTALHVPPTPLLAPQ